MCEGPFFNFSKDFINWWLDLSVFASASEMKCFVIIVCLCAASLLVSAQNLVQNPSFETYSSCPNGSSALPQATPWQAAKNSPEYLHFCSGSIYSDVPTNYFGFQNAATGQAYGGGLFYGSFASTYLVDLREFFYVPLSSPLVIGTTYYLSFKINLADNAAWACNRMGMQFTSSYNSNFPLNNTAHLYSSSVITDKVNWVDVVGSFVPSVAYNAVMVGNFFTDAMTSVTNVGTTTSIGYNGYYLVDDVYVGTTPLVLPVEWVHVGADVNGRLATLAWELDADDIASYTIEVSDDGYAFVEGQVVTAVDGQRSYKQIDTMRSHLPTTFYRIRAIGRDGSSHVSPVVEAQRYAAGIDYMMAYPSPIRRGEKLTIEFNTDSGEAAALQLMALDGKLVRTIQIPAGDPGHHEMQVGVSDLAAGAYLLKVGSFTKKLIVTE